MSLVYAFISIVSPLHTIYGELSKQTWFQTFVVWIKGRIHGLNRDTLDSILKILVNVSVLLFCRDMFKWAETIPRDEFNCYKISELKLHCVNVGTVLSAYCFFFSYWIHGYNGYLVPLSLITLTFIISQMVLLNYSEWKQDTILNKASNYVLSGIPWKRQFTKLTSDAFLEQSCGQICLRLGEAYARGENKPVTASRKLFQQDLLRFVTAKISGSILLQDEELIWYSVGMAFTVFDIYSPVSQNDYKALIEQVDNLGRISMEHQYDILVGMFCGHFLNHICLLNPLFAQEEEENRRVDQFVMILDEELKEIQERKPSIRKIDASAHDNKNALEIMLRVAPYAFRTKFRDQVQNADTNIPMNLKNRLILEDLIWEYLKERSSVS